LRAIERETAMQILYCIDDYVSKRVGGVKKLKPPRTGFRQVSHAGPLRVRVLKRVPVTSDNDNAPEAAYNAALR
jgi:hypothetical protein